MAFSPESVARTVAVAVARFRSRGKLLGILAGQVIVHLSVENPFCPRLLQVVDQRSAVFKRFACATGLPPLTRDPKTQMRTQAPSLPKFRHLFTAARCRVDRVSRNSSAVPNGPRFVRHASEINSTGTAETVCALGICLEMSQCGCVGHSRHDLLRTIKLGDGSSCYLCSAATKCETAGAPSKLN